MTETVDEAPSACPSCPNCRSEYSYQVGDRKVCTECAHEWEVSEAEAAASAGVGAGEDAEGAQVAQGAQAAAAGQAAEPPAIDAASVIREIKDRARQLTSGVVKKG